MRTISVAVALAMLLATEVAYSRPRDVAIHVTRLGGNTTLAQPYVDSFLRYVESATGWTPYSMTGSFQISKTGAIAYVAKAKPGIGIIEPPLYFENRHAWQLQPILQTESKKLVSDRLHVVVKDPAIRVLTDLKGKRLWTTLAEHPKYLSRIVLNGQADAAGLFILRRVDSAMKGARSVLRGDCEATILDDEQLTKAKKIQGGRNLRVIYDSPPLPALPVVAFGTVLSAQERAMLTKVLLEMCGSSKGAGICKKMRIGRFAPLDTALFADLQKRYGGEY
jgi:ABC-type phosphate/phosphonate transport system substrate-binding protein